MKLWIIAWFLISSVISVVNSFSIDPTGQFILDEYGRSTVLRGINMVWKEKPYYREVTDKEILNFKKLGFNLIRLGFLWEAVEIAPGVYDEEYLNKMEILVNRLGEQGIYTLLDTHQDLFSKKFCGDGVPYFYVDYIGFETQCKSSAIAYILGWVKVCKPLASFNIRYDERGIPLSEDCQKHNWVDYHFTPEVTSAYEAFYSNRGNIQDKYADFWKHLASKFKTNPFIVGFDIWNEPFPGGLWDDLT